MIFYLCSLILNLKVSILTVSYQSAATLRQTIESVLAQDYPNIEYWVIDGGSTDGSLEILKSFGSSIHFISEKDAVQFVFEYLMNNEK